jgi:peptide/nickel transport system substrate-binding protein
MYSRYFIIFFSFLIACSRPGQDSGKQVFRYNEAANISSLDPAFARDQATTWATRQLFDGLVQLNDKLEILPSIAYQWEISPDGLEYSFKLRQDVFFHRSPAFGKSETRKVTAGDFVYSFNRLVDPALASPGSWIFNNVQARQGRYAFLAPDDSTFVIRLNQPFPPFLGLLTMQYCSVVPREAVDFYGAEFRRNPVGTGAFRFQMWKEGVKLIYIRNPEYFESEDGIRLPYLDAVAITFLADKQSAFLEFMKGKLDFMSGIDPTYKDEVLTRDGKLNPAYAGKVNLITQPYLNTEYLGFMVEPSNPVVRGKPALDKRVRQAINHAFDRKKMIMYLRNNIGTPGIYGITPLGLPSFDSSRIWYDYDPDKARRLLAEAGYPMGKKLPPVTLTSTSDYLDICKYIQFQVSALGIELNIEVSPPAAVKEMKAQGKLPFFRASWIADYPDAENYLSLFYGKNFCPQGPNYCRFSNPEYDRLYEKAMVTVDDKDRMDFYRQMEQLAMKEAPVVVLYYDQVLRFVQKNISGIGSNPMNLLTLKRVRKTG